MSSEIIFKIDSRDTTISEEMKSILGYLSESNYNNFRAMGSEYALMDYRVEKISSPQHPMRPYDPPYTVTTVMGRKVINL